MGCLLQHQTVAGRVTRIQQGNGGLRHQGIQPAVKTQPGQIQADQFIPQIDLGQQAQTRLQGRKPGSGSLRQPVTQLANVVSGVLAAHGLDREEALYGLHEVAGQHLVEPRQHLGAIPGHSSRAMKQENWLR